LVSLIWAPIVCTINVTMAKLIYSTITSLDGYVEDSAGNFQWAAPDDEVFAYINDLERPVGTYLYGRRLYETMVYWETAHLLPDQNSVERDFMEIWQAAEKIVYSTTLGEISSVRTQIRRSFDPDEIRLLKESSERDITVGGPDLAAQAIKAGLVDEFDLITTPVMVGGGKPSLPSDVWLTLTLLELRRFENGVVHRRYAPSSGHSDRG
jgi:dihydrofolate reductase